MLLISGQEVAKQTFSRFREIAFYEGAGSRIRTDDLLITNQLLYQLSYAGKKVPVRLGPTPARSAGK